MKVCPCSVLSLVSDRKLELLDATLQSKQILLQLRLLVLQVANLSLQFHIFSLLHRQVSLQFVLDSKVKTHRYC